MFYRLPRRFPWDTFRPIFQSGIDNRFATMAFIHAGFAFRPTFVRKTLKVPPTAGFSTLNWDDRLHDVSLSAIDLYCDCRGLYYARRHYARNITAAGIHCGPIIGRAARILIKIYCVVKIVRIMHSVEVQELFFIMLNLQLTKFSFREFEKFSFRDIWEICTTYIYYTFLSFYRYSLCTFVHIFPSSLLSNFYN